MKKELARTLTGALSNFMDENRQGGMCMSSGECEAMEKAFIAEDFDMIGEYVEKKLCGEDERIRKWIINFIEVRLPDAAEFEPEYRAALAWLENQKEQKQTDLPAGFYYIDLNGNRYYSKEFRYGDMKLKVGEQKPVEYKPVEYKPVEYKPKAGEDIYHAINEAIGLAIDIQRSVSLCFNGVTLNVFPESCISEIVSYYHEQVKDDIQREKPEWSEEDNKMLAGTLNSLKRYQLSMPNYQVELQMRWLKSLRPQPQEETKFKVGDRVIIHCRKERPEDIAKIYDGKEGDIRYIFDEEHNPWGHIVVYLKDGCNNGFHKDELEIISSSSWKPSGELLEALHTAAYLPEMEFYGGLKYKLRELYEHLLTRRTDDPKSC